MRKERLPRDPAAWAKVIGDKATGIKKSPLSLVRAQAGRKGGIKRAAALTKKVRTEIARLAAKARWKN